AKLDDTGMSIVGTIPRGLPALNVPDMDADRIFLLLTLAATIALVSFMESIAVAKRFAAQNRYEVDANRELVSVGAGNVAAGFVGGYPVAGSFSRTAINADAGAKTPLASIVTATIIALTLIALTPLFYYTPIACLAAVILVAIKGLIDLEEPSRLFKINKKDFSLLLFAFFATLMLGIQYGVLLSVLASIILIFSRITRPPVVRFGRLPGTSIFRNLDRDSNAKIIPGVIIFRIDASLYFANVTYLKDKIYEAIAEREDKIHAFVIDASTTNEVDTSAITCLQEIAYEFKQTGTELYFTNVRGRIRDTMRRSGFLDQLGEDHFFYSKTAGIKNIEERQESITRD
ncbi:MAG: SulP family inorganic anion transporter, partial [Pseudomonadales bacterium]